MAYASGQGSRSGRVLALSVGVLAAAGLLAARCPSLHAQAPAKAITAPAGSEDGEVVRLINQRLAEGWKANKITPSARANDYEFIRRATLDIVGRIAKPEEIQRFLKDPADSRRRLLIERLLHDDDYATNWANVWTVWLMTRGGALDPNRSVYHKQLHAWLRDEFAKPALSWKEVVTGLLTATGKTNQNGAVNFILAHLGEPVPARKRAEEGQFEMVPVTSRTTRLFLGLQTQCTQCHDHPFNPEWKQNHFWGVNAYFRQVKREGVVSTRRQDEASVLALTDEVSFNREARVFYEKRNGLVLSTLPTFLDGTRLEQGSTSPRRQELALAVTRHENFPMAFVNRLWAHFLGRGFTNPVDDFGEHNPISHPELLDELGKKFAQYGYDPRRLIRWICNSDAYNLTSVANATNEKADADPFFSRMLLKAMSPEQLYESLLIATRAEYFESEDNKERWMRALTVNFGDDEGNEITFNGTVVQALMMMNGEQINKAISNEKRSTIITAARNKRGSTQGIITDLYLAALNRPPSRAEVSRITKIVATAPLKGPKTALGAYQDLFWALLNSNEFILNH